jgi:hypothetical protein
MRIVDHMADAKLRMVAGTTPVLLLELRESAMAGHDPPHSTAGLKAQTSDP